MKSRLYSWEGLLLVTFLIIFAFNTITQPQFLTVSNQINMFQLSIEKLIVVLVMAFIIINAEIDLSVGSMMGLSACAFGWSFQHGLDPALAIVLCLAIGAAGGALNGFFVAYMGLPSLVVTLATLIGFRGLARVMVEDRGITNFPDWFDAVGQQGFIGPVPFALVCFVILFAVAWIVLEHSGFGRKTYVIGSNRHVADFAGIHVRRHKLIIFTLAGVVSAFAGLLYAARVGAVRGDVANGFELDIITIVLLGGASIFGGSGTLVGTGLAILIVLNLRNGMSLHNVTGHLQTGVIGILLIASVLGPRLQWPRRLGAAPQR